MSEVNILNPTAAHAMNPDYGFQIEESDPVIVQVAGGPLYQRDVDVRGRVYSLGWNKRLLADMLTLRQWSRQYRDGFFTYYDIEQARYFTGKFLNALKFIGGGNDQYSAQGIFVEIPNLAMSTYPSNWARDAIFWEQNDDNAFARTKQTGVWTPATNANAHGALTDELTNTNLNATDMIELVYIGYGFRLWARKDANLGIFSVSTQVNGVAELAPANVDLYAAVPAAAAVVSTNTNLKLAKRRVIITATNTKNAASAAKTILFDAIEIMT